MPKLSWFDFVVIDNVAAGSTELVASSLRGCVQSAGAVLTSCNTALGNPCMPVLYQPLVFKCRFGK